MSLFRRAFTPLACLALLLGLLLPARRIQASETKPLASLWKERTACVVCVEYFVEMEAERREVTAFGTVIDDKGTIVLPAMAVNLRFTPSQLKQFKVYAAGASKGVPAEYLGVDALSGWHFIRVAQELRPRLRPVTDFLPADPSPSPEMAEEVWGIGLRSKDEDFLPYIMVSRVALINDMPQRTAIAQHEITAPGLPVFNRQGDFIGLGLPAFGQSYVAYSHRDRNGAALMLINVEESSAFLTAAEARPQFARIPMNLFGRPLPWLGAFGLQPVDTEVAGFLNIEDQGAAVVGEIIEGSPAEKVGLKEKDIILALDGKALPRFRPAQSVTTFLEREVDKRLPGDTLTLTVMRDGKRLELAALLTETPKLAREAARHYNETLGLSVREAVLSDAIMRRLKAAEVKGVIVHYLKPGSLAASAGLQPDDLIREVDGMEIKTYEEAFARLDDIAANKFRQDFVLLVSRGAETTVIRIKLK